MYNHQSKKQKDKRSLAKTYESAAEEDKQNRNFDSAEEKEEAGGEEKEGWLKKLKKFPHPKDWMGLVTLFFGLLLTLSGFLGGWFLGLPLIVVGLIFLPWGRMELTHQVGLILFVVGIILLRYGVFKWYYTLIIIALGIVFFVGDKIAKRIGSEKAGAIYNDIKYGLVIILIFVATPWFVSWAPVEMDWYYFFTLGLVNAAILYGIWNISGRKDLEDLRKKSVTLDIALKKVQLKRRKEKKDKTSDEGGDEGEGEGEKS